MDQDELCCLRQALNAGQHGILPSSASGSDGDGGAGQIVLCKKLPGFSQEVLRYNNNNAVDRGGSGDGNKGPDGMDQDGDAGKEMVLLRVAQAHPGSASGGRDNDGGRWHKRGQEDTPLLKKIVKVKSSERHMVTGAKRLFMFSARRLLKKQPEKTAVSL